MNKQLGMEEIMERLIRLDPYTCIRMRESFPSGGSMRWFVNMERVVYASTKTGGYCTTGCEEGMGGSSPKVAIQNFWTEVTRKRPLTSFFLRFNCPSNVPIPGKEPQVWVWWNSVIDDWEDVNPGPEVLKIHRIPKDRIRPYRVQVSLDRC